MQDATDDAGPEDELDEIPSVGSRWLMKAFPFQVMDVSPAQDVTIHYFQKVSSHQPMPLPTLHSLPPPPPSFSIASCNASVFSLSSVLFDFLSLTG